MNGGPIDAQQQKGVTPPAPSNALDPPALLVLPATTLGRLPAGPTMPGGAWQDYLPAGGRLDPTPLMVTEPAQGFPLVILQGRFVQLPGEQYESWIAEGAPVEPAVLVTLLWLAWSDAASSPWGGVPAPGGPTHLKIPEVLRLGDRASWVQARELWESSGGNLLDDLDDVMDDTELGAILPMLRGVVPAEQLVKLWDGYFGNDVAGIIRTLDRMLDEEVLGLVCDYRKSGKLAGTSADSLVSTVSHILRREDDNGYRALRAMVVRFERVTGASGPALDAADRKAAVDLASELRVKAAFLRICEADRRSSPDLGYLAVTDLSPIERYWLQSQYIQSWTPANLGSTFQQHLKVLLDSNDDANVVMRALDLSREQAAKNDDAENALGLRVAADALGPALRRLTETAADPKLTESDREYAQIRLQAMADDPATVNRLLALPDGEKLVRQGLGLSRAEVARYRVLQATTATQLLDALKGLHGVNVWGILESPEVKQHLANQKLQVSIPMRRVLDAYAELEDARPILPVAFLPGTMLVHLPEGLTSAGTDAEAEAEAGEMAPPGTFQLSSLPDPDAPDPHVVVAAYAIFQAAQREDLAGVLAAVRPLRRSQRGALQDEAYFTAALDKLRSGVWDQTPKTIAEVIADPSADLQRAADALIASGLMGEVPYAFDVANARELAEGLAVDPHDRRMLRYHYVLESLENAQTPAGGRAGWMDARLAMSQRGVPADLDIGPELTTAYENRMFVIDRLDPVARLQAEEAFLGEPDITRPDMSAQELALEAEFMRIRLHKQLLAASAGIDASGVFGWSPETVTELAAEFERTWDRFATNKWTHAELVQLAAAYYDALDAIDRNRSERNEAAQFVGQLAAVVAGVVVIIATAGTGTPLVVTMLMAAGLGAGASAGVAAQFRDYTTPDQGFEDVAHGAVTGALTVAGEAFAQPAGAMIGKQMARYAARSAVHKAVAGAARLAVEGAIDGAIGGAGDAALATALDRATWERSASAIFARFLSAAAQGAFWGGATGAIASPVMAGAFSVAGRLLRVAGRELGVVAGDVASGLDQVASLADQGRFDVALRRLDELDLTGPQRDALTQDLYRRALGSSVDGAAVPEHILRELDQARQLTRGLEAQPGPVRPGERMKLDRTPIEDLLKRLEADLGPGDITHIRKIIYGEIRLAPEELIVKQHAFGRGLEQALDQLASPAERAALPPYEVRVLPPEAFEGMFRTGEGRALTLLEGDRAVVYVRSDAPVRTQMLQEAAHLRQLADPHFAEDVRFLSERNVLDWAGKSAEDRMHMLDVQRRLEIDAQERIVKAMEKEAKHGDVVPGELAEAQARLAELNRHEAEARALTPEAVAEMNAGVRARPTWMDEEARLFGRETVEVRPAPPAEGRVRTEKAVTDSSAPRTGQRSYQVGDEWPKHTYVTSGIDGKVTGIDIVDGATAVTVTPTGGGESRVYLIEAGGKADVVLNAPVDRGTRLGGWSQRYRLIEVRRGKTVLRQVEEVLDAKNNWVERGSSRTTRGEIMEEASELQVRAQLARETTRRGTTLTDWFVVPRGPERWGFDRVVVEFHGEGAEMTALIRVLEVKDYPNSYVPLAEFTAITDNFAPNLAELRAVLRTRAQALQKAGNRDAARALSSASKAGDVQVEVWLGPKTKMGADEDAARSVFGRLRTKVDGQPGNVKLKIGGPVDIGPSYQKQAIEARKAAKTK